MIKKIKKPLSVLLALMMVVSLFAIVPITASAETMPWTDEITTGGVYTCPSTLSHNTRVSGGTEENPVIINITGQTTVQAPIFLRSGYLKIVGNNNTVEDNRGFVFFTGSGSYKPKGEAHLTITDLSLSSTNASNQYIQILSYDNFQCQSTFENVTFKNCNINGSGAVVIGSETTHTFKNCTFEDITGYNAGGISFRYGSDVTMEGCTFKNCTRTRSYSTSFLGGGAVWLEKDTKLTLDGCTFENCTGECGAVGIVSTATLTLKGNTTITGNSSGNLYLPTGATFKISDDFTGTVGVTTQTAPTDSASVTLAIELADTQAALANKNIVSDNENYGVIYKDNSLLLINSKVYTVTWKNDDGAIIDTTTVANGTTPTHTAPTKAEDAENTYTFSGWTDGTTTYGATDTLPAVTGDITYTAQYTATEKHVHDGITFEKWTSDNSLPTEAGNYVLTSDVTLSGTWNVPSGTTNLCLNGHGILLSRNDVYINVNKANLNVFDCNGSDTAHYITLEGWHGTSVSDIGTESTVDGNGNGTVKISGGYITGGNRITKFAFGGCIQVSANGNFAFNGGTIIGNKCDDKGGAIYTDSSSTLTVNGGSIVYNYAYWGGAVFNNGTTTINGGSILYNVANAGGGAIELEANTLNVFGGEIKYNRVLTQNGGMWKGGGIHAYASTLNIKGNVIISDNYQGSGAVANNLYLRSNKNIKVTLVGELSESAKIGVSMQSPGTFTNSADTSYNDATKFTADGYAVYKNSDGQLYLKKISTVTWKNDDGTIIDTTAVANGTTPTHTAPTKAEDAEYTYEFAGWSNGTTTYGATDTLPAVTGDITYTATYTETLRSYTITWKDGDNKTLKSESVAYGTTPSYTGATPTKTEDDDYTYEFNNTWSPSVASVTGNATYTAQFTAVPKSAPVKLILNVGENGKVVMDNGTFGNATDASNISYIPAPVNVADGYKVFIVDGHSVNLAEGGSINIATGGEVSFYPSADNTGKITAIPDEGYICTGWYNGDTRYTTKDTIDYQNISENMTLTAKFAPKLFPQHSVSLGGDIGVNFYINPAAANFAGASEATVKFTWDGGGEEDRMKEVDLTKLTTNDDGYYKVTVDVVAAHVAHKIHAEVTLNGAKLDQTDDYSVQDYAEEVYKNPEKYDSEKPEKLQALAKALLNYGAMAQTVFKEYVQQEKDPADTVETVGKTDFNLISADDIAGKINGTASDLNAIANQLGFKYYTSSVLYLQNNTLRLYFTPNTYQGAMPHAGDFKDNQSNYYYYVEKENIPAAELDDQQTFTIGGKTFTFSALDYAAAVVNSGMGGDQKDLAKALYLYNQAANAYFD